MLSEQLLQLSENLFKIFERLQWCQHVQDINKLFMIILTTTAPYTVVLGYLLSQNFELCWFSSTSFPSKLLADMYIFQPILLYKYQDQ